MIVGYLSSCRAKNKCKIVLCVKNHFDSFCNYFPKLESGHAVWCMINNHTFHRCIHTSPQNVPHLRLDYALKTHEFIAYDGPCLYLRTVRLWFAAICCNRDRWHSRGGIRVRWTLLSMLKQLKCSLNAENKQFERVDGLVIDQWPVVLHSRFTSMMNISAVVTNWKF